MLKLVKMSQPVTEVATIVLLPDINIEHGPGADIWQSTLKTLSLQPGFQKYYYGLHIEDNKVLTLLVGELITTAAAHQRCIYSRKEISC